MARSLQDLELAAKNIGRSIKGQLPKDVGFMLFVFDFGDEGWMTYTSSAQRSDGYKAILEWLEKEAMNPRICPNDREVIYQTMCEITTRLENE